MAEGVWAEQDRSASQNGKGNVLNITSNKDKVVSKGAALSLVAQLLELVRAWGGTPCPV
jgi:hypothetical protein